MDDETEDQMMARHDRNVQIVADSVAGLFDKFAPRGLTPVAVFEGCIKGAAYTMITRNGDSPADVAELLEEAAAALRAMPVSRTGSEGPPN